MGLFSKAVVDVPPTAIDLVAPDPEKVEESAMYGEVVGSTGHQIDPEMEKRVVRKLDKNLVTLVTVLCKKLGTQQALVLLTMAQICCPFWTGQTLVMPKLPACPRIWISVLTIVTLGC